MPDYMVVMGGQSETGELVPSLYAYVFDCNIWVNILSEGKTSVFVISPFYHRD